MAAVRGKDTKPEKLVRSALHRSGFRYSLHRRDLPGKPDLVLPKYKTVVFVHGCFWHGHECPRGKKPATRKQFWNKKLNQNRLRDQKSIAALEVMGWNVFVVWECSLEAGIDKVLRVLAAKRANASKAA
jgi:DNA mismatch endonuclease (patch repair protein)